MAVAYDLNRTLETNASDTRSIQHPPGYREGVFPRETLGKNETIYWEGKPSLASYLVLPVVATLATAFSILYITYRFLEISPYADLSPFFTSAFFWEYIVLPLFFLYIIQVIRWYRTSFAITNLRVLTKYGVFTTVFCDCRHEKIQNSVIIERFWQWICGYGTLLFATGGYTGGIAVGTTAKMRNGGGIYWVGVPHPYEIKRYCEDIVNYSINRIKKSDAERLALAIKCGVPQGPTIADSLSQEDAVCSSQESNPIVQSPVSIEEKIASLNRLKDDGIISWDDYERMRKKVAGVK